ncbi:hypothetical protein, partial [Enterococcus avium]|uniref:hypothetical protein n=1 Tax=Enterococcus avium TaxID=33945 RepID=UPI00288CE590
NKKKKGNAEAFPFSDLMKTTRFDLEPKKDILNDSSGRLECLLSILAEISLLKYLSRSYSINS